MMLTRPRTSIRLALAGLAAAALLTTAACGSDEKSSGTPTSTAASSTTTQASTTETSASPTETSSSAPTASSPASTQGDDDDDKYTDQSLAALLRKVKVDGEPLSPMPIATVRAGGTANPEVSPKTCEFAATGFLPLIRDGAPAAIALNAAGLGASVIDAGSEDKAKAELAKRNKMMETSTCSKLSASSPTGGKTTITIRSEKVSFDDLDDARYMISSTEVGGGKKVQQVTLSGHHDGVLVNVAVPSTDKTKVDQIMKSILNELD